MPRQRYNVYQGDAGPYWVLDAYDATGERVTDISDADWVGTLTVKGSSVSVVATKVNNQFVAQLSPANTASLSTTRIDPSVSPAAEGVYVVGFEVKNDTLNLKTQTQYIIQVRPRV